MGKVLIVSPFYPPYPKVGATKRLVNFVRYLPLHGWEPLVLTMNWGRAGGDDGEGARIHLTRNIAYASWKAYQLADIGLDDSRRARALRGLVGALRKAKKYLLVPDELILWFPWVIGASRKIVASDRPDAVFVTAPPFSSLLIGVMLKKVFRIPLVCDVRDDWVGNPNPLIHKGSRVIESIEREMERWIVRNADRLLIVTEASLALWRRRYPWCEEKFVYIPNGYSEDEFGAAAPHRYEGFSLVHVGSLEEVTRTPEPLFRALSGLDSRRLGIRFHQCGLALAEFREMARRYGLEETVRFEGLVSGEEAMARIKGASVLVLIPSQGAPSAIPGKAYEYLRTGKPILLISDENATTGLMRGFANVYPVAVDDVQRCRDVILALHRRRDAAGAGVPDPAVRGFERRELAARLGEVLGAIAGGGRDDQ